MFQIGKVRNYCGGMLAALALAVLAVLKIPHGVHIGLHSSLAGSGYNIALSSGLFALSIGAVSRRSGLRRRPASAFLEMVRALRKSEKTAARPAQNRRSFLPSDFYPRSRTLK